MLSILECGQMEHARTARPGLTLDKIVLSVTLLAPLCLTLTVQAAALGLAQSLAITREHRCCCTISQPTRKRRFAKILQPTRECRFATLLLCSLHASAGLHLRCLVAHTQVQACNLVVMQPARRCRFASRFLAAYTQCRLAASLPCSPHACAGLPLLHLAAYTRAQVRNPVVMQPTRQVRVCIHVV